MRLATVLSHPIQYYYQWFQFIENNARLENKVFYLWDYGIKETYDIDFKKNIVWHLPILEGYNFEILNNVSSVPGTHHLLGLNNPDLIDKIAEYNPEAILVFGYFSLSHLKLLLSRRLKKIPKILKGDSHRLFYRHNFKNSIREAMIRNVLEKFKAALFVGKANRSYFLKHGMRNSQLFFSPHCVDENRFFPDEDCRDKTRKLWHVQENETVVIFCGKLEQKKCPVELAIAFSKNDNKNLRLFYVGSGKLEKIIRNYAEKDKRIKILGFVDQSKIAGVYRAADFVVLPSYGEQETWGFCIHEAISCGTAAICSTHVGCSQELINDGKNGYIFKAGDWNGLSQIFCQLRQDNFFYRKMGMYGLEKIKKYNYKIATQGLLSSLEYLLNA